MGRPAYNPNMVDFSAEGLTDELDAWLATDGLVLAASERAARALTTSYHQRRRDAGLTAWAAPRIVYWQQFLRQCWQERTHDPRLVLSALQEQTLWASLVGAERQLATALEGPRARMGKLAMEAHALLCAYAPEQLAAPLRAGWQADQASFSRWLEQFDARCANEQLLSSARLPLELLRLLEAENAAPRPPLLLVGFDRLQPTQRRLLTAWGQWHEAAAGPRAASVHFYEAEDEATELAACARWCRERLNANPEARLMVIAQNLERRRGVIERGFLRHCGGGFEFSLGVPLSQTTLVRGVQRLLRWLRQPMDEHEVDWLISTGQTASSNAESAALALRMKRLRRRDRERARWTLDDFVRERCDTPAPEDWVKRLLAARTLLNEQSAKQTPLAWSELVPRLLAAAGWPGARPFSSSEYQNHRGLLQALETAAALGFDGQRIDWFSYLSILNRVLHETLFAAESAGAPILIAGPTETAGLAADGIWFLGATEEGWPATAPPHPLLPIAVLREAQMPHALPKLDWALGEAITRRLLSSSPEVHFSYARQKDGVEARASRLVTQQASAPQPLPAQWHVATDAKPLTVLFEDRSRIPFPPQNATGGSSLLTNQSQCPFKAFATVRLDARGWQPAEAGLTAKQRGTLLHAVLHSVWSGAPHGIRTQEELLAITDHRAFAAKHVERVFADHLPPASQQMPRRYLELEQKRLARLVAEWLDLDATRAPFTVVDVESDSLPKIGTLALKMKLDRIDRLKDDSLLIVDYKSGEVSPKSWDLPRPEDAQLPLYASFGVPPDEVLGGLVFAKVRTGQCEFAGRVGDAREMLLPSLSAAKDIAKHPLTAEMLMDWRDAITKLARDFVEGRAEVDPRQYPQTCAYCELHALCRIGENRALLEEESDAEEIDA